MCVSLFTLIFLKSNCFILRKAIFHSVQVKLTVLGWLHFQKSETKLKIVAVVMRKSPNLLCQSFQHCAESKEDGN